MAEYTWAFDKSFLVFLAIAFLSMALAAKIRSLIPMPLIYGTLFILGFATGVFPKDMLLSANMIAVGTIAYHVLVVHSGTMINLELLRAKKGETILCLVSLAVLTVIVGIGMIPVVGKEIALLSPGSVVGGGASCAIASRLVLEKAPKFSVFPWLVFMFQGLFSVPIVTWALKKESKALLEEMKSRGGSNQDSLRQREQSKERKTLCQRIPNQYKTTPYYLGVIMIVTVLNNILQQTLLAGVPINGNVTALLLGLLLGSLGWMERAPLFRSDSYGLLLLGLMGLMANTLANCPWQLVVSYLPALLEVFAAATAVLVGCGIIGAKLLGFRPSRGIALTMNCMMGFPVNDMLLEHASREGQTEGERDYLKRQLGPVLGMGTMLISNALSILVVSVLVMLL